MILVYVLYSCFLRVFFFLHMVLSNTNNFYTHLFDLKTYPNRYHHDRSKLRQWRCDPPQISRTGASPWSIIKTHTQGTHFRVEVLRLSKGCKYRLFFLTMRVDRKLHRLTKILSWYVIKWGLFFKHSPTPLWSMLFFSIGVAVLGSHW